MDISKLTIQGFKSFYDKSVFTFGKNITAIVGPNGSGKSNITEAIRFVLGEQSTKSMRGKDLTDLLFRGNSSKASKAKVEIEFIKRGRLETKTENIFIKNILEKDTVTVSRTIYADGKSEYSMNGVEVRLKDLHEFLLYINLGNKNSWHISQGEADRVLTANPQERKTIIEDALGLKVYHARINESERKLEKTRENMKEATIKRRELLPELNTLSKQVEKIKRADEFRTDLENKAKIFLSIKEENLTKKQKELNQTESLDILEAKLSSLERALGEKELSLHKGNKGDISILERELEKEEKISQSVKVEQNKRDEDLRKAKVALEFASLEDKRAKEELEKIEKELKTVTESGNDMIFSEKKVLETKRQIEGNTEKIQTSSDLALAKDLSKEVELYFKQLVSYGSLVNKDNVQQISYLQSIRNRLQEKLQNAKVEIEKSTELVATNASEFEKSNLKIQLVIEKMESLKKQILEYKYELSESERELQKLTFERSNLVVKIAQKKEETSKIEVLQRDFENDLREFKMILGPNFNLANSDIARNDTDLETLKRSIERLKIRLEEAEVQNPEEVMNNFKQMSDRDNFLLKEISDLENSIVNLEKLISDLKENLKQEFELGLLHINNVFDAYIKKLFNGGSARVTVIEIENRKRAEINNKEDIEPLSSEALAEEDGGEKKLGIEVEVEIPKKKVKGLHSLSGGERALVSIALNFSIINQNPAPFMILDETDAALDEANSKRYGEMLDMLKKETRLIVVTHNRETMHFADQVYGVTISKDGQSKVLSVSFEDAVEYAK